MTEIIEPKKRHNVYMTKGNVVLSEHDAKLVSDVLELHILSNLVKDAPKASSGQIESDLKELNDIQGKIVNQLDVSSR